MKDRMKEAIAGFIVGMLCLSAVILIVLGAILFLTNVFGEIGLLILFIIILLIGFSPIIISVGDAIIDYFKYRR